MIAHRARIATTRLEPRSDDAIAHPDRDTADKVRQELIQATKEQLRSALEGTPT